MPTRQKTNRKMLPALAGMVLVVLGAVGWFVLAARGVAGRADWLVGAITSPMFVTCMIVFLACGAALLAIGGALVLAGAPGRFRRRGQDGAAIVEFALVLPIALVLVLVMGQSSLLMGGNLCVHYAAYCAARSAIVTVPLSVSDREGRNYAVQPDSAKHRRMRLAAIWALMGVSCGSQDVPQGDAGSLTDDLAGFFQSYDTRTPGWIDARLARKYYYADKHTTVTLHAPDQGSVYGEHEDIRVSVTHTLYLSVPYADRLFALLDGDDGVKLDFPAGRYGIIITAGCSLTNEGVRDYIDVEQFPPS